MPFHHFKVILLLIGQNFSCLRAFGCYTQEPEARVLLTKLTLNSKILRGERTKGKGSMGEYQERSILLYTYCALEFQQRGESEITLYSLTSLYLVHGKKSKFVGKAHDQSASFQYKGMNLREHE